VSTPSRVRLLLTSAALLSLVFSSCDCGPPSPDAGPPGDGGTTEPPVDAGPPPVSVLMRVTPGGWLFTAAGEEQLVTATATDLLGADLAEEEVDALDLEWVSNAPEQVSVTADPDDPLRARLRAEQPVATAVVVVRSRVAPELVSAPVVVTVAPLRPAIQPSFQDDEDIVFPLPQALPLVGNTGVLSADVQPDGQGGLRIGPFTSDEVLALFSATEDDGTVLDLEAWATRDPEDLLDAEPPSDGGVPDVDPLDPDGDGAVGGTFTPDGFVPDGQAVIERTLKPLPTLRVPLVLRGAPPAVGDIVIGRGVTPLLLRVESAVARDGFTLVQGTPLSVQDVFSSFKAAFDWQALDAAGFIGAEYEARVLGPNAGAQNYDEDHCGLELFAGTLEAQQINFSSTKTFVFDFALETSDDDTPIDELTLRFGYDWQVDANPLLVVEGSPKLKLKCEFDNVELLGRKRGPVAGPAGAILGWYIGPRLPLLRGGAEARRRHHDPGRDRIVPPARRARLHLLHRRRFHEPLGLHRRLADPRVVMHDRRPTVR
jgi:hypothetical protein